MLADCAAQLIFGDAPPVAAGQKLLHHPSQDARLFEYATFQANEDPCLKLAIYTPV